MVTTVLVTINPKLALQRMKDIVLNFATRYIEFNCNISPYQWVLVVTLRDHIITKSPKIKNQK